MEPAGTRLSYTALARLADRILADCEDDPECIALRLGGLAPADREELLVSDLLNAWQVFFFFFRTADDELRDRLELEPASELPRGVRLEETDIVEMTFTVREGKPVITLSDGEKIIAAFSGSSAFAQGREFMKNPEYQ